MAQASTVSSLALDDSLAGVDASRMLLVDTETTGLHGGTGTLPAQAKYYCGSELAVSAAPTFTSWKGNCLSGAEN